VPAGQTACNNICVDLATDEANCGACGKTCDVYVGFICSKGRCVCSGDEVDCDGFCADLDTDPYNCGTCGRSCGEGSALEATALTK
jgi:hypothetical protein